MSTAVKLRGKDEVYQRGVIACSKCGTMIPVTKQSTVADEFSVRCPSCGHRDFYLKRAIVIEEVPERRKKPR
jgi:predicted Zn finger-like uncharacterized protein